MVLWLYIILLSRIKQKYHKCAKIGFILDTNEKSHKLNITQKGFFLNLIDSQPINVDTM